MYKWVFPAFATPPTPTKRKTTKARSTADKWSLFQRLRIFHLQFSLKNKKRGSSFSINLVNQCVLIIEDALSFKNDLLRQNIYTLFTGNRQGGLRKYAF